MPLFNIDRMVASVFLLLSGLMLTACGGGASGGGTPSSANISSQGVSSVNISSSQSSLAQSVISTSSSRSASSLVSLSSASSQNSSILISQSVSSVSVSVSSMSASSQSSVSSSQMSNASSLSSSVSTSTNSSSQINFSISVAGLLDGQSTAWEQARDVAVDDQGNIYVVGGTSSNNFPVTSGAFDTNYNDIVPAGADTSYVGVSELGNQGATDAFVVKMDPQGKIIWSTYLGGPNYDRAYAVEVDAAHNVYIAGRAGRGFPTTAGSLQPVFAGDNSPNGEYGKQDGFIAKLSADGSQLLWATYFGDSAGAFVRDLDIDAAGRVHVAATSITATNMNRFVTAGAAQSNLLGTADSFYARLSANGSQVEYGTFLGGNDTGNAFSGNPSVRALPDGTAYVLVNEQGPGAPVTSGAYQTTYGGKLDMILAKFSPVGSGGKMDACTYFGGSDDDFMDTHHLTISPQGNPIITAGTKSPNFPVTDSSALTSAGKADISVSVLSSDLKVLLYSRLIGGTGGESSEGISTDAQGNIYVTGSTGSSDLPVTSNAIYKTDVANEREGFLLVYSPDLATVKYFSYDKIPSEYGNRSSIVGPDGTWYAVGATWHMNSFPIVGPASSNLDAAINGTYAAFFEKLVPAP